MILSITLLAAPLAFAAQTPLDGFKATHILVSQGKPPLDVPPVMSSGPAVAAGLIGGLVLQMIVMKMPGTVDQRRTAKHRKLIADLAGDPAILEWTTRFRSEVSDRLRIRYGTATTTLEQFDSAEQRQRREVALDQSSVLKAEVNVTLLPHRDCGIVGVVMSRGEAYFKKALDIKRRAVETYVPKTEAALVLSSEWCLPGSRNTYKERKVGENRIDTVAELMPILDLRKAEILEALVELPVDSIDPERIGTIGPRDHPFHITRYGRERSWIADAGQSIVRLVPNGALQEYECNSACGPFERAKAIEKVRREDWISRNGAMTD